MEPTASWEILLKIHTDDGAAVADVTIGMTGSWELKPGAVNQRSADEAIAYDMGAMIKMFQGSPVVVRPSDGEGVTESFSEALDF